MRLWKGTLNKKIEMRVGPTRSLTRGPAFTKPIQYFPEIDSVHQNLILEFWDFSRTFPRTRKKNTSAYPGAYLGAYPSGSKS